MEQQMTVEDTELTLHQFLYSHFNEKARWALDFKNVPHQRRSYLPGPHRPAIQKLSGQGQTPVLCLGPEVIAGSAQIIDTLEQKYPDPALYPADTQARENALTLQARFDADIGPAVRTALFSVLIKEGGYLTRMFARDASAPVRVLYRATFPLARGMIAKGNGVTDTDNVTRAFELTEATLREVTEQTAATGYLVGHSFSIADLTAAALLAPLAALSHPDMARPKPVPPALEAFYARWADDPAITWVRHQYAKHR
jgi:glutathione S-transferase